VGNVNAHGRFRWVRDGELRVEFDPIFPNVRRAGSTPDDLVDEMAAVGFDVAPSHAGAAETDSRFADLSEPWVGPVAGSFALAERLTRVAVSRELLDEATFFCGEPRSWSERDPFLRRQSASSNRSVKHQPEPDRSRSLVRALPNLALRGRVLALRGRVWLHGVKRRRQSRRRPAGGRRRRPSSAGRTRLRLAGRPG
jgi:hypothetical protein